MWTKVKAHTRPQAHPVKMILRIDLKQNYNSRHKEDEVQLISAEQKLSKNMTAPQIIDRIY